MIDDSPFDSFIHSKDRQNPKPLFISYSSFASVIVIFMRFFENYYCTNCKSLAIRYCKTSVCVGLCFHTVWAKHNNTYSYYFFKCKQIVCSSKYINSKQIKKAQTTQNNVTVIVSTLLSRSASTSYSLSLSLSPLQNQGIVYPTFQGGYLQNPKL